jgi:uncharacterized protein (TIGR02246 family)
VSDTDAVTALYERLIAGWNSGDAGAMASAVAADGLVVGFDRSQMASRDEVAAELARVFADHETATYVTKVRSVRLIGGDAGLLHAVAGMAPPTRRSCPTGTRCRPSSPDARAKSGASRSRRRRRASTDVLTSPKRSRRN